MGYTQFPDNRYYLCFTVSDTPIPFGKIDLTTDQEIRHIQTHVIKEGAHSAGTKFRMHISPNEAYNVPIVTSAWIDVSEIDSLTSSSWAGYLTFTFDRTPLEADNDYWVHIEITGYTNPLDESYYWGFAMDWPEELHTHSVDIARGGKLSVLGYE